MKLLYPRGATRGGLVVKYYEVCKEVELILESFLYFAQTCDIDVDSELQDVQREPFILVLGPVGQENTQYFICAERALTVECSSFREALLDLLCCYYVFNIQYPSTVSGIFLFFQHFVCNLKDEQIHPNCLAKLLKNILC